jgi:hypothetical protein
MDPQDGNVPALVDLIVKAASTVQNIFSNSSKPHVPSLNDLSPHPFDTGISDPNLKQAIRVLQGACAQLTATVERRTITLLNLSYYHGGLQLYTDSLTPISASGW